MAEEKNSTEKVVEDFSVMIVRNIAKVIVFLEYMALSVHLAGLDLGKTSSWLGIGLALIIIGVIVNINKLYVTSFLAVSSYYAYLLSSGVYNDPEGGIGPAFVVGAIVMSVSIFVHLIAFYDFDKKKEIPEKKDTNEKEKLDEVA